MEAVILVALTVAIPFNGLLFVGAIQKYNQAMRVQREAKQLALRLLARRR